MTRPDPNARALATLATIATLSAALGAVYVVGASWSDQGREKPPRPPESRPLLIGIGCGPGKRVMTAREEDELPACNRIEPHWTPQ